MLLNKKPLIPSNSYKTFPFVFFFEILILIISILVAFLSLILSVFDKSKFSNSCNLEEEIYLTTNISTITSNFTYFISDTKTKLDIAMFSRDKDSELPQFWNKTFKELHDRKVAIRVFTNNKKYNSNYATFKYSNDENTFVNFAISDEIDIFFPSSFDAYEYHNETVTVSYIAMFKYCKSAGDDLTKLFEYLWNKDEMKVIKKSYIADRGFQSEHESSLTFLVEPLKEFPLGRQALISSLSELMFISHHSKYAISENIFPNTTLFPHESVLISSLFELTESFIDESSTYLVTTENNFYSNIEAFRSMISNMIEFGTSICNAEIFGTILFSTTNDYATLLLLPCGIGDLYTGSSIVGLSLRVEQHHNPIRDLMNSTSLQEVCLSMDHPAIRSQE